MNLTTGNKGAVQRPAALCGQRMAERGNMQQRSPPRVAIEAESHDGARHTRHGARLMNWTARSQPLHTRGLLLLARLTVCLAAGIVALPGQGQAASGQITLESDGTKRTAFIVENERLKKVARPTIIVLHGADGRGTRVRRNLGMEDAIRSNSVVMAYPDALNGNWDVGEATSQRDMTFIRDLVTRLIADGIADRRRIYLLGASTGGLLAFRLACTNPGLFAAASTILASMPADLPATCKPGKPLPLLVVAGTGNPLVPFNGGKSGIADYKGTFAPVNDSLTPFAKAAGCKDTRTTTAYADRDPTDGSRAFLDKFDGCSVPVEMLRIEGGGHTIPGRYAGNDRGLPLGAHNVDVDAAKIIWDFFRNKGG